MLAEVTMGQDPLTISNGDNLASISELPADVTDLAEISTPDGQKRTNSTTQTGPPAANGHPRPKTDKPRPHVCTTCARSFARLEHLKRHERSHTKEKPFECPECARCFARRDLLLRHQQKLHTATTPSSRPRNTRRESTGGTTAAPTRVRKNSVAGISNNSMRPRANTISHIDGGALELINGANVTISRNGHPGHSYHPSVGSVTGAPSFDTRGFSSMHHLSANGLPKIETSNLPVDLSGSLRTAPVFGTFPSELGFGDFIGDQGSTINPNQLHFAGDPQGFRDAATLSFGQAYQGMATVTDGFMDEENNFDWVNGFDTTLPLGPHESAIDESSPSAMSTGSQSGTSEPVLEGSRHLSASSANWQAPFPVAQGQPYSMDFSSTATFQDLGIASDTMSPKMLSPTQFTDPFASQAAVQPISPSLLGGHPQSMFSSSMVTNGESPNSLNVPFASSPLRLSVPTGSPDTFTDSTRQALLASMSQPSKTKHRNYSHSSGGSMYNRDFHSRPTNLSGTYLLPSTFDLQRYISAYINYFHPHLPFLHIPTLDFQAPEYTNNLRTSTGHLNLSSTGVSGGGGCLILSMAAIGALYEFDTAVSKDLFESAKKMIQLYLEERRKADMSAALSRTNAGRDNSVHNTPLWLVQAMLLNVIYGHTCGDKTSADIASTHCAALVSLARAAELNQHIEPDSLPQDYMSSRFGKTESGLDGVLSENGRASSCAFGQPKERKDWFDWKIVEERKRTLYAIFTLSSFLVSAYNHAPALTNSEIRLDLPCEEDLWAAESPQAWKKLGGAQAAKRAPTFSSSLTHLLTASQRQQCQLSNQNFGSCLPMDNLPESDLRPSTFGCLVLIHALHNYIWETRQRHMGRQWTPQETDAMQAHIEPALRAWQAAWASNSLHSLERPNPFGAGPLSADSIPLLDLAYVRLFVNLSRAKEAFWQRDWNAMADELATGAEIIQHADDGPVDNRGSTTDIPSRRDSIVELGVGDLNISTNPIQEQPSPTHLSSLYRTGQSKRERHLRKAAFYAADSICMADRLGNTFSEFTSRELPLQCAMCSFDCSQVLAEWITTVQERVGPYLGVLGRDDVDLTQVPGIILLEDEDCKLIDKIKEILNSVEVKMKREAQNTGSISAINALQRLPSVIEGGYGSKILVTAASLLDRAAVWPLTKLMARALETQAMRMKERAENSVLVTN